MKQMLYTLELATTAYTKKITSLAPHEEENENLNMCRDSVVTRLKYCVDHFWKLLKFYLEEIEELSITINSPRSVARTAASSRLLSEEESCRLITLIEERNKTSHIYKQEIADEVARFAPQGLIFMRTIVTRLETQYSQKN
jgi:nucleotidyltransferase substrate binding protein (TIGR01987 family)